ncbi:MAG: hypothetical protein JNL19_07175 [Burkholderiales bacterium]|nr:hypothetical protein [Burkholderiales bacterium]
MNFASGRHILAAFGVRALFVALVAAASFNVIGQTPAATGPVTLRMQPATSLQAARVLPPTAIVELPSGRRLTAQQFNAQVDMVRRAQQRTAGRAKADVSITRSLAPVTVDIKDRASLAQALARPDSDTVRLPDGATLTVANLRKLGALAQRERGRNPLTETGTSLVSVGARALNATPVMVRNRQELMALKGRPDNTVVQAPNGARVTLGEIRVASMAKRGR